MQGHEADREPRRVWSLGHSNRTWDAFEALLHAHGIKAIADIRAFPSSRRWPHFNREAMAERLAAADITYDWLPDLGGRRRSRRDSPHTAWTVDAFRNYADHMDTEEFQRGLDALLRVATDQPTAFCCAEALHWRCHRRLIADRLQSIGWHVLHIHDAKTAADHEYPPFLRVVDGRLLYDVAGEPGKTQGTLPFDSDQ
jgi:uncharacterized protein (DUF488 family)